MSESQVVLFVVTSLVLIIVPGQDMVLVMSRSITQGSKAGVATAAGISTGLLTHTLLAALGLGALLQASETLFVAIKILGALYLCYLGLRLLRTSHQELVLPQQQPGTTGALFFQGALSNLSNPKFAVFYFSYLPQFVPSSTTNPVGHILGLGIAFAALTFLIKGPVGYTAGASGWLRAHPAIQVWIHRMNGSVLIALGVKLALERRD